MLQRLKREDFKQIFHIMEDSFPTDEYRTYAEQEALLEDPAYEIYVMREDSTKEIRAFAAVWEFEDITFVEHLAVAPAGRNAGMGSFLLKEIQARQGKRLCLEVELPETELAVRRIGFYERNGFSLNTYPYMQPSISEGRNPVPLMIMTTQGPVSREEFDRIKELLYRRVYESEFCV